MRDPARIDRICELLAEVWKKHPDQRLGQLLFNITGLHDVCHVEDDVVEEALKLLREKGFGAFCDGGVNS
jgi:uncharacterized protein YihD (DUF1040 family)